MPQDFIYPLTLILDNGNWGTVVKPAIREYFSTDNEEDTRKTLIQFNRFKRILTVELVSRIASGLGLGRGNEGLESNDTYNIAIKTGNYQDAMDLFSRVREICIHIDITGEYNRITYENPNYTTQRGVWLSSVEITCYRAGKVRK
jgi:hypothetical protein